MNRTLSTSQVARILGTREARVREWLRTGLCRTRRGRRYAVSFQDLVVLRAAQGLLEKGVPPGRVRAALAHLARELPAERPLSGLRIRSDGRRVAICDAAGAFEPETGQTLLDFEVDALAARARASEAEAGPAAAAAATDAPAVRARREFQEGLDLEDEDPKRARQAYTRAVELDATLGDAWVNLGRLVHEAGDAEEALRLYHCALETAPDDPIVHFNLGLALEDVRRLAAAASHYERALALDPDFADAHWNLAGVCEELGRAADALRHYRDYQRLTEA